MPATPEPDDDYSAAMKALSPLAYWRLSELTADDSTVLDYVGTRTGTNNGATREVPGLLPVKASECYDFSSSYFVVADDATLRLSGSFSAGAWVNMDTVPNVSTWATVMEKAVGASGWTFKVNNSRIYADIGAGGGVVSGTSNTVLVAATTYLLGYSYDSVAQAVTFYRNGVADGGFGSAAQPDGTATAATSLFVGMKDGASEPFDGRIDEPFVTVGALTAAQWAGLYMAGQYPANASNTRDFAPSTFGPF